MYTHIFEAKNETQITKKNEKINFTSAVISSALFLTACGGGQTEQTNEGSAEEAPKEEMTEAISMSVAADESQVMWTGGTAGAMVFSLWNYRC